MLDTAGRGFAVPAQPKTRIDGLLHHHLRMPADRQPPLPHDDWLGPLWRYGDHSLIGSISIQLAIRPPRHNGETDAEVLLDIGCIEPGPELDAKVSIAAARIRSALAHLAEMSMSCWQSRHRGLRTLSVG
jgi:hypothetical protein